MVFENLSACLHTWSILSTRFALTLSFSILSLTAFRAAARRGSDHSSAITWDPTRHMTQDLSPNDKYTYIYIYIVKTKTIFRKYLYATKVLNNFLLYFLQLFANQMLWETWSTNGSSTSLGTCMAVPKDSSWCPGHLNLHWSSHLWLCCCAPLLRQLLVPSQCCSSWQCDARWQPAAERN